MSIKTVQAIVNGESYPLALNSSTGTYEAALTAPAEFEDNQNEYIFGVTLEATDDAGNTTTIDQTDEILGASLQLTVNTKMVALAVWISPRTNWVSTDRFNIEDYNRIKGNLEYVHMKATEINGAFEIADMGEDKTEYTAYFYADEFNLFEKNLDTINQNIFTQNYGVIQTFYENGPFIQWEELNRIESAILSIWDILKRQKAGLRKLSFRLGSMKGVRT